MSGINTACMHNTCRLKILHQRTTEVVCEWTTEVWRKIKLLYYFVYILQSLQVKIGQQR